MSGNEANKKNEVELAEDENTSRGPLEPESEGNNAHLQEMLQEVPTEILAGSLIEKIKTGGNGDGLAEEFMQSIAISQQYSGPIPPPAMLDQYDRIHPGLAEELVKFAKDEQLHRQGLETMAVSGEISKDKRGQNYALIICLAVLAVGTVAIITDAPVVGGLLSGSTLTGLAYIFITGRKQKNSSQQDQSSPVGE